MIESLRSVNTFHANVRTTGPWILGFDMYRSGVVFLRNDLAIDVAAGTKDFLLAHAASFHRY